jgi:hypothetical protein
MSLLAKTQQIVAAQTTAVIADPSYATFVVKAQKAKTRKGKDYFVLRITIPKDAARQGNFKPDDYVLIKAKLAQWYHMVNWLETESAWKMLPQETKMEVWIAGLPTPDTKTLVDQTIGFWPNLGSASDAPGPVRMITGPTIGT